MLWALLAYYFFGSGGTAELGHFYNDQAKDLIKTEVKDPQRRDNAQVFAKMIKQEINTFLKQTDQETQEDEEAVPGLFLHAGPVRCSKPRRGGGARADRFQPPAVQAGAAESGHRGRVERHHR